MRFVPCGCGEQMLQRIRRPGWVRVVFPARRLYYCWSCDATLLIKLASDPQETALSPLAEDPLQPHGDVLDPRRSRDR